MRRKEGEKMAYGRILIIDDDTQVRRLIERYLEREGMEVFLASRFDDYAYKMSEIASVILVSNTLANVNIASCITRLREIRNVPIIVMVTYGTEQDSMMYYRVGADQIISKPFNIAELSLRVKALIRRTEEQNHALGTYVAYRGMEINVKDYCVLIDGKSVELSPKEIEILFMLVSRPEKTFSRGEISSRVWGRILSDNRTISVHINRIRNKIGAYSDCIAAVRGVGYKFTDRLSGMDADT